MIHNEAHKLANAMKNSQEYQAFLVVKRELDKDASAKKMVQDFMKQKLAMEYETMSGQKENPEKMARLQQAYTLLANHGVAREFVEKHMRLQQMMGDVFKIINDAVAEGMDIFAEK